MTTGSLKLEMVLLSPPCPVGTRCKQDFASKENNYTCVLVKDIDVSKRGYETCPAVSADSTGPCVEQCRFDVDCASGERCCSNGCGHTCRRVASRVMVKKPGSCPWHAREAWSCDNQCQGDFDCPGRNKCCLTSCGTVCAQLCCHWLTSVRIKSTNHWRLSRRCGRSPSSTHRAGLRLSY